MSGAKEECTPISRHTRSWRSGKPRVSTLQRASQSIKTSKSKTARGNQGKSSRKTLVTKVGKKKIVDGPEAHPAGIKLCCNPKDNPLVDTMAETVCILGGGSTPLTLLSPHSVIHPPPPLPAIRPPPLLTPRSQAYMSGIAQDQRAGVYNDVLG